MAKNSNRKRNRSNGVLDIARERPVAAVAAAAGAAAAGLFLWSRRAQISDQLSNLSDQIGEWSARSNGGDEFASADETTGHTDNSRTAPAGGGGRARPTPTS